MNPNSHHQQSANPGGRHHVARKPVHPQSNPGVVPAAQNFNNIPGTLTNNQNYSNTSHSPSMDASTNPFNNPLGGQKHSQSDAYSHNYNQHNSQPFGAVSPLNLRSSGPKTTQPLNDESKTGNEYFTVPPIPKTQNYLNESANSAVTDTVTNTKNNVYNSMENNNNTFNNTNNDNENVKTSKNDTYNVDKSSDQSSYSYSSYPNTTSTTLGSETQPPTSNDTKRTSIARSRSIYIQENQVAHDKYLDE